MWFVASQWIIWKAEVHLSSNNAWHTYQWVDVGFVRLITGAEVCINNVNNSSKEKVFTSVFIIA